MRRNSCGGANISEEVHRFSPEEGARSEKAEKSSLLLGLTAPKELLFFAEGLAMKVVSNHFRTRCEFLSP